MFVAGSDWISATIRLAIKVARVSALLSLDVCRATGRRPIIATMAKERIASESAASTSEKPASLDLIERPQ
jgi:hypothetical protein